MAEQYWIGGFFIDLSRNQITQNQQSQTLAPKALAVLTYLAENKGKVVSHDALLTHVWQDTIVSPNTLQRSIAQLRKALGDDGKVQFYIKTHAKQGYSLECDVRWHNSATSVSTISAPPSTNIEESTIDQPLVDDIDKSEPSKFGLKLISILVGIIILGVIGYQNITHQQTSELTFDKIRSLTATDDKEFDATYSPDGEYIVFHRYLDKLCVNKIWAKNIRTQKETLLTEDWGAYGSHSFSKDGKKLIFLATEACNQPVAQKSCFNLVSLDFEKALTNPQQPSTVLECRNSVVKNPTWLSNNNIALLQKTSHRWKLINYSISDDKSTDIYVTDNGNLIDYAYSDRDELIAAISIDSEGQHHIEMLKPDGRLVSSNPIEHPPEIPKYRPIYPSFDPLNKQLIFSTGRQLFTLSYEGKINKINLPVVDRIGQPEFHPDGKKLLLIKGPYDSDIVLLPLAQAQLGQPQAYPSFERSNRGEDYAMFQPDGELIAFWSERSGEEQLWTSDGKTPKQLSQFPTDTYIRGMDWAADGQSLLVNANNMLTQIHLDSKQKSFPMKFPVIRLFQWDSTKNSALLLLRINGIIKLVEFDMNDSEVTELSDKIILWALKSDDGRLIYKDHMDQFWQPGPAEDQRIKILENQGGRSKTFVTDNNIIYAVNEENKLWSYNLNNKSLKILGEVGASTDYLTDVNQTQLLMTVRIAAKKEVVELSSPE